jgi:hypothetical protein
LATCSNCGAETDATVETADGPVAICDACLPVARSARSAVERLAGETEIVVASLANLGSQIELLDRKVDALDARHGREASDLRAQIDRAVSGLETDLSLLQSDAATSAVAQTRLTWLGAVILGGFIVRACH